MTRLIEAALFLSPIAAYVLWRYLIHRGIPNPSRRTLIVLVITVSVLGSGLIWTSLRERTQGDVPYVPARMENGRIVPGHGA